MKLKHSINVFKNKNKINYIINLMKICGLIVLLCLSAFIQARTIDDDKVVFPDFPAFTYSTYSGFLTSASGK
jgi:hypothetical protein